MQNRKNLGLWLTLLVVVILSILKVPVSIKLLLIVLFLAGLIFLRRSVVYYIRANRKIISDDQKEWEGAWPLYRKAIKAGLSKQYTITAASMFLQRGNAQEGKEIIENYLNSKRGREPNLDNVAKTMLSMAYWMEGDLAKAIEYVKEVREKGFRDKNLFINYSTYALADGDLKTAESLINDAGDFEKTSPGIRDNRGWLMILKGEWEQADELFTTLVDQTPKFPEPYVHYAQVKIHFGQVSEAITQLESALQARFSNTSGMNKEIVQSLLDLLKAPATRRKTALEIDGDTAAVAAGKSPKEVAGEFEAENADILEGFAKPSKKIVPIIETEESEEEDEDFSYEDEDLDDRLPNTDLTEEDIEYIKEHEFD